MHADFEGGRTIGIRSAKFPTIMSKILSLAVLLLVVWVILKVVLAITSGFLHVLWIIAVIFAVVWLFGKLRGNK